MRTLTLPQPVAPRATLVLALLIAWVLAAGASLAADEGQRKQVPGHPLSLVPPAGFTPSTSFAGFQDVESGASLLVMIVGGPIAQIRKGFESARSLAEKGMQLVSTEERKAGDLDGVLSRIKQSVGGQDYDKWVWAFGDAEQSVLVMGTWLSGDEELGDRLLAGVLSARYDDATDPLAGLGFSVEHGPLVFSKRVGNNLVYVSEGAHVPVNDEDAFLVVGPAVGAVTVADPELFARQRLVQTAQYSGFKVESARPIAVDDLNGIEIVAVAESSTKGEALVYQVVLFEGATYWLAQGFAPIPEREHWLPILREAAASLRRERATIASDDGTLRIALPHGWSVRERVDAESMELAHATADCFLSVAPEAKDALDDTVTLERYAEIARSQLFEEDDEVTVVNTRNLTIGGMKAVQCELRAAVDGVPLTYLHTTLDGRRRFHRVVAWTTAAAFAASPGYLESLVATFEADD